ncbi:hypothetical protein CGLO_17628 [Colletotrichum gloeosporioides Cg-14]|uniref:Fungal N-terminal domain-containing protein n=1 Tax=Colletotrichum gloeosporioides (strain Cg-14) TaxID=1237896 RepID=T0JWD7_COLGC|nr:hypothetical protein CGLO_17628 [Colletotrichum gloeosporioides Cg-14]
MAEALGIASGVIAVVDMATKIGGGSIKLKRLWDEINEVPAMLLQKAELVQGWDQLFDEAEHQLETQTLPALINNRVLLQKFTSKARAILSELQVMIDGLIEGSTIGRKYRRKIGSAKVILRKSDIKALNEKLDEVLAQYQMAQSLYTMATLMQNPILSIEGRSEDCHNKSGNMQAHPDPPTAQSDSVDERIGDTVVHTLTNSQNILKIPTSRTVIGRLRLAFGSQEGFQFSLRTPDWLSSSVYSVVACKSVAGWTVNLRAYEVIPNFRKTDLADLFIKDDALAIFKYLDDHRMTPFVRNYKGASLLQAQCFGPGHAIYKIQWTALIITWVYVRVLLILRERFFSYSDAMMCLKKLLNPLKTLEKISQISRPIP